MKDVYDVVNRLEDKFDGKFEELDARTTSLESFQNKAIGIWAIVTLFLSSLASFIWVKVTGK